MRSVTRALCYLLIGLMTCAANVFPVQAMQAQPTATSPLAAAPAPTITPLTRDESELILAEIAESEGRLNHRLDSLKPDPSAKWMPGIFVLLGALIASGAGFLTQRAKLNADDRLSRRTSGRTAIADIMDFRSRQLNE